MKGHPRAAITGIVLVLSAVLLPRTSVAQPRFYLTQRPPGDLLTLRGPGSSIGVSVRDLTNSDTGGPGRGPSGGAIVQSVREKSPADLAGFKSGDIVVEFDGERVRSVAQFRRLVRETAPGRSVTARVLRQGLPQTLNVTPEQSRADSAPPPLPNLDLPLRMFPRGGPFGFEMRIPGRGPARLGAQLQPLSSQLADFFGVREGVLVSAVDADSPAARAGLKAGDVITDVNGTAVREPGAVADAVRNAESGARLELRVMRDHKAMTITATIDDRREPAAKGDPI